jgi:hypothetical protein
VLLFDVVGAGVLVVLFDVVGAGVLVLLMLDVGVDVLVLLLDVVGAGVAPGDALPPRSPRLVLRLSSPKNQSSPSCGMAGNATRQAMIAVPVCHSPSSLVSPSSRKPESGPGHRL